MRRLLVAMALLGGCLAMTGTARAAAIGQCTSTRGTIVAVDFGHWGGPVVRGCGVTAGGAPDASGYALLQDGGFTVVGDERDGPAFVCRLGDTAYDSGAQHPNAAEDACVQTPPASAYWSYWLAEPGSDHWVYSPKGVLGDRPVAGEVQLWQFGATGTGGTTGAPAASLIARLRAPAAVAITSAAPASHAPAVASTPPASASRSTAVARHSTPSPSRTSSHPPTTAPPTVTATAGPGRIVTAASTAPARVSHGSVLPVVLTVGLVALLGGGGLVTARRRRG